MRLSDEAGYTIGFFTKLFVFLGLVGIVVIDGSSILFAKLRADDAANAAATAAAVEFDRSKNVGAAERAAVEAAHQKSDAVRVTGVEVNGISGVATVRTREHASTLVVERVGFLKGLAVADASGTASPPS